MLFRSNHLDTRRALFDAYPVDAHLKIGMDSDYWVGNFVGLQNGVALLTDARRFANNGSPLGESVSAVTIPLSSITTVEETLPLGPLGDVQSLGQRVQQLRSRLENQINSNSFVRMVFGRLSR